MESLPACLRSPLKPPQQRRRVLALKRNRAGGGARHTQCAEVRWNNRTAPPSGHGLGSGVDGGGTWKAAAKGWLKGLEFILFA